MRRSEEMSESFLFDVDYSTSFEQLEALRDKMLVFLKAEKRDFLSSFDVTVVGMFPNPLRFRQAGLNKPLDFPNQESLSLKADIKYKGNWQQGALKGTRLVMRRAVAADKYLTAAKRRNKWICALKVSLAEVKIFGPKGNPKAVAAPERRTQVPWEEVKANEEATLREASTAPKTPVGGWQLLDKNNFISEHRVFGLIPDSEDLYSRGLRRCLQ